MQRTARLSRGSKPDERTAGVKDAEPGGGWGSREGGLKVSRLQHPAVGDIRPSTFADRHGQQPREQPVELVGSTVKAPENVRVTRGAESVTLKNREDFIVWSGRHAPEVKLEGAELVFVG